MTLSEFLECAKVFRCSAVELLMELETGGFASAAGARAATPVLTPAFYAVFESEEALLAQLARHGIRFLGGGEQPVLFVLPIEEVVLAALRHHRDPRIFEVLPALLLAQAKTLDWTKLAAAAYSLKLQNRLGMAVSAALEMRGSIGEADDAVWDRLEAVRGVLADAKLDQEEFIGSVPRTDAARDFLRSRTPPWLRFWHGVGSADLESYKRHLRV